MELAKGNIVSNIKGEPQPLMPQFGTPAVLLVDAFLEADYDSRPSSLRLASKLFDSTPEQPHNALNISRGRIDEYVLWHGAPENRLPNVRHKATLEKLHLSSTDAMLRCIAIDEYARMLITRRDWGRHDLRMWFDGYSIRKNQRRDGLSGGPRKSGGGMEVSQPHVGPYQEITALRLVVVPRQNQPDSVSPLSDFASFSKGGKAARRRRREEMQKKYSF